MASKRTTKKTCAAGGSPAIDERTLKVLEALGIDTEAIKQAMGQHVDLPDIAKIINVNNSDHFGTQAIKYSKTKSDKYYYEHGFINSNSEFVALKRSRVYLEDHTITAILDSIRWTISKKHPDGKLPKEVKEAINDLHSLL